MRKNTFGHFQQKMTKNRAKSQKQAREVKRDQEKATGTTKVGAARTAGRDARARAVPVTRGPGARVRAAGGARWRRRRVRGAPRREPCWVRAEKGGAENHPPSRM
jgi:hypothetical protein